MVNDEKVVEPVLTESNGVPDYAKDAIGAVARHWFNLRNRGQKSYWPIPVSLAAFLAVAYVSAPSGGGLATDAMVDEEAVPFAAVQGVIVNRCRACQLEMG